METARLLKKAYKLVPNLGSFRDPSGYVYESDGRIFRAIFPLAAKEYEAVRDSGFLDSLVSARKLVATREINPENTALDAKGVAYLLEHPKLPYIS